MRQSAKETMMLQMQAECTFAPREASVLTAEAFRPGGVLPVGSGEEALKSPWTKPGR